MEQPTIFKARIMQDGAAYISAVGDNLEVKVKRGVLQLDMNRDDMTALRDVLSVALSER